MLFWKVWCDLSDENGKVYDLNVHCMIEKETENKSHEWKITIKWINKINWIIHKNKKRTSLNTLCLVDLCVLELLYLLEGIGYNHLVAFACGMLFPYRIPYAIWSLSFACFGAYDMFDTDIRIWNELHD